MPVYLLIDIHVIDSEPYAGYVAAVHNVVTAHGGRYVVQGGDPTPLGGGWEPERIIIIEFDSIADVRRCFSSPDYLALAPLRERSTTSRAVILQGAPSQREGEIPPAAELYGDGAS
jgi:uncharacterized protein (DUF1330 family)